MLYFQNLIDKVFDNNTFQDIDQITIISGYVGVYPIKKLSEIPSHIHITVIYGMYGMEQISAPLHKALLKLQMELPNVDIMYSTIPVHSKIYMWTSNRCLKKALVGSANFTRSGLENNYKEVLADADQTSFAEYKRYCEYVRQFCIPCTDSSVIPNRIKPSFRKLRVNNARKTNLSYIFNAGKSCIISFLGDDGEVTKKSGLNWCLSNGHVAKNDAYIKIPADLCKNGELLFPPKKYVGRSSNPDSSGRNNRENDEIELLWDDGTIMAALLEGTQIINGVEYPKQISSSPSKSILGKYLRKRLNVDSEHTITKEDLLREWGRTDVTISLISDGVYYVDLRKNS